jgi:3-oxoadipate enol-lactonase
VVYGDFWACDHFDIRRQVHGIELPSLVLVGTHDQLTPPKYAGFLASQIAGARLEIIETAGHGLHMETPNPFNQAVKEFLASLD